jgi:hypothetical protein
MVFSTATLERVPWRTTSLLEDHDQHLHLLKAGVRVEFASEVSVVSRAPVSRSVSLRQQRRWEAGKIELFRRHLFRLITESLRRRDVAMLAAGVELAIPPLSLLAAGTVATYGIAVVEGSVFKRRLAIANLAALAAFVLGGLAIARAPAAAYRSLAYAPLLALEKATTYTRLLRHGPPRAWERTQRGPGA